MKILTSAPSVKPLLLPFIVAALLAGTQAQAHQFWIEPTASGTMLRFGEFADNVRETAPGLLDSLGQPAALLIDADGEHALTLDKTAQGYTVPSTIKGSGTPAGASIVAEDIHYPVSTDHGSGAPIRWAYTPAARYISDFAKRPAKLTFDIVPTGKNGQFQVTLNGKPMQKIKVVAAVPAGWTRQAQSDAEGMVSFALPWRGMYVIEAVHDDRSGGERGGKPYDIASYSTSLSFVRSTGSAALPAPQTIMPATKSITP
jgi:hypothetical protein